MIFSGLLGVFVILCFVLIEIAAFVLMLARIAFILTSIWARTENFPKVRFEFKRHEQCSVCLSSCTDCVLECNHCFHWKCAVRWLRLSNTCPICRKPQTLPISAGSQSG